MIYGGQTQIESCSLASGRILKGNQSAEPSFSFLFNYNNRLQLTASPSRKLSASRTSWVPFIKQVESWNLHIYLIRDLISLVVVIKAERRPRAQR